jgi:hypothetical protein
MIEMGFKKRIDDIKHHFMNDILTWIVINIIQIKNKKM